MDFTKPEMLGGLIEQKYDQLMFGGGYDHNYVLNKKADELSFAARVYEPTSGRVMEAWSTEPGLQLFSGNSLGAKIRATSARVARPTRCARGSAWSHNIFRIRPTSQISQAQC